MKRLPALLDDIERRADRPALIHSGSAYSYRTLSDERRAWGARLEAESIPSGAVVAVQTDYSLSGIALLLALLERGSIAAMLPRDVGDVGAMLEDARAAASVRIGEDGHVDFERYDTDPRHPLLDDLRARGSGGFVIFTSGSTGRPKAVLHDIERFLTKYAVQGKPLRTLAFLLFDHIAGMDTLFYALAAGGSLVLPDGRDPHSVCRLIETHHVEVLPTSPSFLRLMLLSGAHDAHDLSSLKIVTYGSEPMDPTTLARVTEFFSSAKVIQKYGTSELGSPRSRSREPGSLWLDLETEDVEAKVVDGVLWLRSTTAMLGYLNAEAAIDAEGWYCTGDRVESDGSWIRFIGRESEIINVGGEKVRPQEVEDVILELDYVRDAVAKGVPHPLLGQVVHAEVVLVGSESIEDPQKAIRRHCRERLPRFKVPVKVTVTDASLTTARHKKKRN
jgi:acyl-coenzyme A synthetase/AMP-(fatty) acid ligase